MIQSLDQPRVSKTRPLLGGAQGGRQSGGQRGGGVRGQGNEGGGGGGQVCLVKIAERGQRTEDLFIIHSRFL